MKIAIMTINDNDNYGNRLQNFALQMKLESLGHSVITIDNKTYKVKKKYLRRIYNKIKNREFISSIIKRTTIKDEDEISKKLQKDLIENRKVNFERFNKLIHLSDFEIDSNTKKFDFVEDIDYFVVGSDQVWNYTFNRFSSFDFCSFSPKEKNISYAASIGLDEIDDRYKEMFISGLHNFKKLSVRETKAQEIIQDLVNLESEVLVDPTMLITPLEWNNIINKHSVGIESFLLDKDYIVVYFLGEISDEDNAKITKYCDVNNYELLILGDINYTEYSYGPLEFISAIQNSKHVFTDSFHACVFSIIFEKSFTVFDRKIDGGNMNSRIITLLSKLGLESAWNKGSKDILSIDYDNNLKKVLSEEMKKSENFLKQSLM